MTVSMLQTLLWQLVQAVVVIVAVMGNRFHSSWFPGGRGGGGVDGCISQDSVFPWERTSIVTNLSVFICSMMCSLLNVEVKHLAPLWASYSVFSKYWHLDVCWK